MKKSLILLILPLLLTSGCGERSTPTFAQLSPEDIVIANAHTVQQAAEAFALQNAGQYAWSVDSDTTLSGKTLKDFLPGAVLLTNPFTGARTEPFIGAAGPQGQIGYITGPSGDFSQYTITGFGADTLLIILSTRPPLEIPVIRNCYTVQWAVEAFAAQNNGVFPFDVGTHRTPTGQTLIDFLPGGIRLENPFTKNRTEPNNHSAMLQGETGYVSCGSATRCYAISGYGEMWMILTLMP